MGLDLCPRLKELSDRHLFLPRGSDIPENLKAICHATLDPAKAARHWDAMVHLFASVHSGHSSAITVLHSEQNGPCIQQVIEVPGIFAHVFANKVPALLARKSRAEQPSRPAHRPHPVLIRRTVSLFSPASRFPYYERSNEVLDH